MFYQEKEINALILCPACSDTYDDPRLLPCGESMCHKCIIASHSNDQSSIDCQFCHETHAIPHPHGFTANQRLAKLVAIKPDEVYRGKCVAEFKQCLHAITTKSKNLAHDLASGHAKIKEYCDFARNDVDLLAESWLQYIHNYRVELLKQIDDYEHECISHYETFCANNEAYATCLRETHEFRTKWRDYLEQFHIDKAQLSEALTQARALEQTLTAKEKSLKSHVFNGRLLKFEKG